MKIDKVFYPVMAGRKWKNAPLVFKEYNKKACGVDVANNMMSQYRQKSFTAYWWGTVFKHFLMVTVTNAYIIYVCVYM